MKKIFSFLILFVLLNGCAESMALLGTSATNGKLVQSSFNTALSYGVKQKTGKSTVEHALNFVETQGNPKLVEDKKDKDKQD